MVLRLPSVALLPPWDPKAAGLRLAPRHGRASKVCGARAESRKWSYGHDLLQQAVAECLLARDGAAVVERRARQDEHQQCAVEALALMVPVASVGARLEGVAMVGRLRRSPYGELEQPDCSLLQAVAQRKRFGLQGLAVGPDLGSRRPDAEQADPTLEQPGPEVGCRQMALREERLGGRTDCKTGRFSARGMNIHTRSLFETQSGIGATRMRRQWG